MAIVAAAALTWVLPAGEYDRKDDPVTGRKIVVPGTYHAVARAPVGPFATVMSVPRGFGEAVDVIAVVFFVGGAWVVVDRIGTLSRIVAAMSGKFSQHGLWAIPVVSIFFGTMGALENMQEEIIPLVPVLLLFGRRLGVDPIAVVAMSAGAAMIGSAFGPTNPFQAGIALKLAQLPPLSSGGLRLAMFIAGVLLWILWTVRHASCRRVAIDAGADVISSGLSARDWLVVVLILSPMAAGAAASMDRSRWAGASTNFPRRHSSSRESLQDSLWRTRRQGDNSCLSRWDAIASSRVAVLIGLAREIFLLVLADGHVIDTILNSLANPLRNLPGGAAMFLMVPLQALVHVFVPSVSGQAVLTMPVMAPLADLLGQSRQLAVLAYQTGAGLMELLTPTNGALMAVLLAAGVSYRDWMRFALAGVGIALLVSAAAMTATIVLGLG